jgi:hypothetical protein
LAPVYLEESEIEKILRYEPFDEKLEHFKNLFVVQIFTEMVYIDVIVAPPCSVKTYAK